MGSLLLILVAVALLVIGLANGSSGLLISSIGASLLAAVALVVGARQAAAMRIEVDTSSREGFSPTATGRGQPRPPTVAAFTPSAPTAPMSGSAGRLRTGDDAVDRGGSADPDSPRRPNPFDGPDPRTRPDPFADSDPFEGPDPRTRPDPFADSDPFDGPDPRTRPDPFDGPDRRTRSESDPFTRPDPFADPDPPVGVTVPSQGGQPEDQTPWRQPAEPYRRSARGGEHADTADEAGEAGAEFAVVDIPPDEPDAQRVAPATAARVARLTTDVMVIDGRPRYHLSTCPHLVGRESEPLPVAEAVELGFTPCGRCEPDDRLLADAGRV